MKKQCIIFDCDGLMFDTEVISQETFRRMAPSFGYCIDDDFIIGITGSTKEKSMDQWNRYPGLIEYRDTIVEEKNKIIFEKAPFIAKPGLIELLDFCVENDIKIAVASSSPRFYVQHLLQSLPNNYHWDAICTAEDVVHHKPAPDVFLLASQQCNVSLEQCIVLEDSKNGLLAAHRATIDVGFIKDTIDADDDMKQWMATSFNSLYEVISYLQ